jgi:hypothetical protein
MTLGQTYSIHDDVSSNIEAVRPGFLRRRSEEEE